MIRSGEYYKHPTQTLYCIQCGVKGYIDKLNQRGMVVHDGAFHHLACGACGHTYTKGQLGVLIGVTLVLGKVEEEAFMRGYETGMEDQTAINEDEAYIQYAEEWNSGIMEGYE